MIIKFKTSTYFIYIFQLTDSYVSELNYDLLLLFVLVNEARDRKSILFISANRGKSIN